jgi:hypothetical protein
MEVSVLEYLLFYICICIILLRIIITEVYVSNNIIFTNEM